MGDGVQAAKAGILEVGDVFVINKADRDGADQVRRELRSMIALGDRPEGAWRPPIVKTVASKGVGVDEGVAAIEQHREHLVVQRASSSRGGCGVPATRSRRSRSPRCASSGAACTRTRRSTSSPPRWSPGSPIPTPRPTCCWTASRRDRRATSPPDGCTPPERA